MGRPHPVCVPPPFLLPQLGAVAVQTEEARQSAVADISATGAVLLRVLGEGVEQAPPRRFHELVVAGLLELPEDRHDVAAVDGSDLCGTNDCGSGFVGFDLVKFQIFGEGFVICFTSQ